MSVRECRGTANHQNAPPYQITSRRGLHWLQPSNNGKPTSFTKKLCSYFQVRHWNSSQIKSSVKAPAVSTTCPSKTSCANVMALLMCSNVRRDASKASRHAPKERSPPLSCKRRKMLCKNSVCIRVAFKYSLIAVSAVAESTPGSIGVSSMISPFFQKLAGCASMRRSMKSLQRRTVSLVFHTVNKALELCSDSSICSSFRKSKYNQVQGQGDCGPVEACLACAVSPVSHLIERQQVHTRDTAHARHASTGTFEAPWIKLSRLAKFAYIL